MCQSFCEMLDVVYFCFLSKPRVRVLLRGFDSKSARASGFLVCVMMRAEHFSTCVSSSFYFSFGALRATRCQRLSPTFKIPPLFIALWLRVCHSVTVLFFSRVSLNELPSQRSIDLKSSSRCSILQTQRPSNAISAGRVTCTLEHSKER